MVLSCQRSKRRRKEDRSSKIRKKSYFYLGGQFKLLLLPVLVAVILVWLEAGGWRLGWRVVFVKISIT